MLHDSEGHACREVMFSWRDKTFKNIEKSCVLTCSICLMYSASCKYCIFMSHIENYIIMRMCEVSVRIYSPMRPLWTNKYFSIYSDMFALKIKPLKFTYTVWKNSFHFSKHPSVTSPLIWAMPKTPTGSWQHQKEGRSFYKFCIFIFISLWEINAFTFVQYIINMFLAT